MGLVFLGKHAHESLVRRAAAGATFGYLLRLGLRTLKDLLGACQHLFNDEIYVLNLIDTFKAAELEKLNESYLSLPLLSLDANDRPLGLSLLHQLFLRLSSGFQP